MAKKESLQQWAGAGKRLKALLIERDMTQEELAEATGLSVPTIGRLAADQATAATVAKVATALQVELDHLVRGTPRNGAPGQYGNEFRRRERATGPASLPAVPLPARTVGEFTPNPHLARRLPPRAYAKAYAYLQRLHVANVPEPMIDEAERLMIDAAFNKLNAKDPRERTEEELIVDIDDAWDFITDVLKRQGFKP